MPMGTIYQDPQIPYEQKILVIDPAGEVVLEHFKYGGVGFEGNRVNGDGILRTAQTPFGVLSALICWDTDFPRTVSQAGCNGTDILLSPSLGERGISPLHSTMAILRTIENGVSLVRVGDNELSVITDSYWRVLASMDYFTAGERVIVAQVPTQHVFTLYSVIGDLLGCR
jgi:apolipoprotein N-acyltransferase